LIPTNVKDSELVIRRRRQIVRAAMKQFAKKGFFKTSIRDIAAECGISLGAIYNYVRNKEEILILNQTFFLETAGAKLRNATQHVRDPLEKLRRLIRIELQLMDRFADYHLLVTTTRQSIPQKYSQSILQIERERIKIFDDVLEECIQAGKIKPCNIPRATKFIKVLIDSWINKQWIVDHSNISEMETAIFDLFMNGMSESSPGRIQQPSPAATRTLQVLLINGETPLSRSIASFCREQGTTVSQAGTCFEAGDAIDSPAPVEHHSPFGQTPDPAHEAPTLNARTLIRNADVIIHDLGIGTIQPPADKTALTEYGKRLDLNLKTAQDLAVLIQEEAVASPGKRLIYLAPWQWDQLAHPVRFEVVREGVIGLTGLMARKLAMLACQVYCIVPGFLQSPSQTRIDAGWLEQAIKEIPLGDLGSLQDLMHTVWFLTSDAAAYSTGTVIRLSGGMGI